MLTAEQRKKLAELLGKSSLTEAEQAELKSLSAIAAGSTEEKEFELDTDSMAEIAKHVTVDEDSLAAKIAAKMAEAGDKPVNKQVGDPGTTPVTAKSIEEMDAQTRTRAHLKALKDGDKEAVKAFNQHAIDTNVKAGYMNVSTTADGGGFVPDADMLNEVFSLEANYGVAARLCRTVNVSSDSVKAAALSATVSFTEVTTETGTKATTKPSFTYPTVDLREFAGIVVMTDQLLEDAAFDVRGFVAEELARAAAKKEDELLLTDATTGLTKIAGTVVVRIGAALANLDFDDVIDAQYGVPTASQEGGTWVLARAAVPVLRKIKSSDGSYIWGAAPNADTPATINGAPYYISEVMQDAATGLDKAYAVFGNFGRYAVLIRKAGLKLTFHDSGTVNVGGTDYNLIQQDMTAMRAVIRRNVFIPLPGAFAVLKSNAS